MSGTEIRGAASTGGWDCKRGGPHLREDDREAGLSDPRFEIQTCFSNYSVVIMSFIYTMNHCEHEIAALLATLTPRNDVKFGIFAQTPRHCETSASESWQSSMRRLCQIAS